MLSSISTIQETTEYLTEQTCKKWGESFFLDFAWKNNIILLALVPRTARAIFSRLEAERGWVRFEVCTPEQCWIAVIRPDQIKSLLIANVTTTEEVEDGPPSSNEEVENAPPPSVGQTRIKFIEPVRVIRADVRVPLETVKQVLKLFREEQAALAVSPVDAMATGSVVGTPTGEEQAALAGSPVVATAVGPVVDTPAREVHMPLLAEWKVKSIALADEIGLERFIRGERQITVRNIVNAVAISLAKGEKNEPQKYHGTTGPRDANSIRKHALKGWKFKYPSGANGADGAS